MTLNVQRRVQSMMLNVPWCVQSMMLNVPWRVQSLALLNGCRTIQMNASVAMPVAMAPA